MRELVELRRASVSPEQRESELSLARSLVEFSHLVSENDRPKALELVREAVDIYRRLVTARGARFAFDLADSLFVMGNRLRKLGRCAEAIAALEESVQIRKDLSPGAPAGNERDIVRTLLSLAKIYDVEGDDARGLVALRLAVDAQRRVANERRAYAKELIALLTDLAAHLCIAGDSEGITATVSEALSVRRALATSTPAQRGDASDGTSEMHETEDSLDPAQRKMIERDVAKRIEHIADGHWKIGARNRALLANERAAEIYHGLVMNNPETFAGDLARSLLNLGLRLKYCGDDAAARAKAEGAVELYRRLVEQAPERFAPHLANALKLLCEEVTYAGDAARRPEAASDST